LDTIHSLQGTKIALLIDFDNVILGVDDPGFDVELVVNALRTRGIVVMGRAYGDWYRHHRHRRKLMEQGIELVETPVFGPLIKNSADIRIVLDGFEIAMSQAHIDTFCLVSGDSDFLPLIKKLQYLGKRVIVIAGNKFTSDLVRRNCNEYIAYENLLAESVGAIEDVTTIEGAYQLLERAINTLNERLMDVRSSTVKQMMMQLNPAFSERTFGCNQFKQFLDKAARANVVRMETRDGSSGEFSVYMIESEENSRRSEAARAEAARVEAARQEALRLDNSRSGSSRSGSSRSGSNLNGRLMSPPESATSERREPISRDGERRGLANATRSGRKFSGRAGKVEQVPVTDENAVAGAPVAANTPTAASNDPAATLTAAEAYPAETVENAAPATGASATGTPATTEISDIVVTPATPGSFTNVLAQRTDLRRGRLRFSAKAGKVLPQQAAPTVATATEGPSASSLPIDESAEQTGPVAASAPASAEGEAPAEKKKTTRGGRRTRASKAKTDAAKTDAVKEAAMTEPPSPDAEPTVRATPSALGGDADSPVQASSDITAEPTIQASAEAAPEVSGKRAAPRRRSTRAAATKASQVAADNATIQAPPAPVEVPITTVPDVTGDTSPEPAGGEAAEGTADGTEKKKTTRGRRGGTRRSTTRKKSAGDDAAPTE
jgi:uncharacterized protein (TIGR00288 family)